MILTTHAMEEAEILCDRLGIFVSGVLKTVGAPAEVQLLFESTKLFSLTN